MLFDLGRYDEAIGHFEAVAAARNERDLELQVTECLLRLGRYEDARERLASLEENFGEDPRSVQLGASILGQEVDLLWTAGQEAESDEQFESQLAALNRAAELAPREPMPYVLQAEALFEAWRRKGTPVLLEDALAALERADRVRPGFAPVSLARVAILEAQGQTQGIIGELGRVLELEPGQNQVRLSLIRTLLRENMTEDAIAVTAEGVRHNPADPDWPEQVGDLLLRYRRDRAGAVDAYNSALALGASPRILDKLATTMLGNTPIDHAAAIRLLTEHDAIVGTSPKLQSTLARSLLLSGKRDAGLTQLREAYASYRAAIADGSYEKLSLTGWYNDMRPFFGIGRAGRGRSVGDGGLRW